MSYFHEVQKMDTHPFISHRFSNQENLSKKKQKKTHGFIDPYEFSFAVIFSFLVERLVLVISQA